MRSRCCVRRVDKIRPSLLGEGRGRELSILERVKGNVLKCSGYVERMREEKLVEKVYRATVEVNRGRERP